jgi:modulator of FtsH protease HflK
MADQPQSLPAPPPPPETPVDAGSQALSEALRSSFFIVKIVMVVLVLVFLGSGFFTVGPQQQAIILRLGRPVQGANALLEPGPHWSYPRPIDEVHKVSITGLQQVKSSIGWYAVTPEEELAGTEPSVFAGAPLNPEVDGYLLTADTNIVHAKATLTYRIRDPIRFVFSYVNASNTVQNALDNALLFAASRFKVDDLLTRDVIRFKEAVRRRATELVEQQDLGVVVEDCVVERTRPPRQLQEAFDSVLKAEVKRNTTLTEARGFENQTFNTASAEAASRISFAKSERARFINEVSSHAKQFLDLLPKYNENRSLFVDQRLTETLGRVFTNAQDKIFMTESATGDTKELRLLLNREPVKHTKSGEEPKP